MTSKSGTTLEFEALFEANWPRIFRFLAGLLGDPDEAQDMALEAFIRLHARPDLLQEPHNPAGWLYRTAANLGYNALRSRKRRRAYEQKARAYQDSGDGAGDPALAAEKSLEGDQVRAVLADMRPRSAKILLLRHTGLSYREISEATGVAAGSVGTLLARAEKEFERRYRRRFGAPDLPNAQT